ncbi:MAG: sensor domain-containing diguanylate cyclase [Candidatus Omnitrophica bacterium]|nr:sensor domain-containing diguanylate cyclase [Candidatus Omnitrophota bacterium]
MTKKKPELHDEKFRLIFEHSPVSIWEEDFSCFIELRDQLKEQGVVNYHKYLSQHPSVAAKAFQSIKVCDANRAALKLHGSKSKEELIKHFGQTFTRDDIKVLIEQFVSLISGERIFESEFSTKAANGKRRDLWLRAAVPNEYEETLSRVIITIEDITARKKKENYLKRIAQEDSLTGLLNHKTITKRVDEELNRCRRYNAPMACLMVDIDHFKPINDNFGHQIGDRMLKQIAGFLNKLLRNTDLLGRYGGDEFLIILTGTEQSGAIVAAERIRETIANKQFKLNIKSSIKTTLSIGATSYPANQAKTTKEFIHCADKALYQAKADGRNCVHFS